MMVRERELAGCRRKSLRLQGGVILVGSGANICALT